MNPSDHFSDDFPYTIQYKEPVAIEVPLSKSISARLLMMEMLAKRPLSDGIMAEGDDIEALLTTLNLDGYVYYCHSSGTALRLLTAYLAMRRRKHLVMGSEQLERRPIGPLVDALRSLGASITYLHEEGFAPLLVGQGPLQGGEVEVDARLSSQFASALLLIAPYMKNPLRLKVRGPVASRSYLDMTVRLMRMAGCSVEQSRDDVFTVEPGTYAAPFPLHNEACWTAASYMYEAVALSAEITQPYLLYDLQQSGLQGDEACAEIFSYLGVGTLDSRTGMYIYRYAHPYESVVFNLSSTPDLAPTVVATCLALGIAFRLNGLEHLRVKESNRLDALQDIARTLGFCVERPEKGVLTYDGLTRPQPNGPGAEPIVIDDRNDHRLVMAFAPLRLKGWNLKFKHPSCVQKSFPSFWDVLQTIG